MAIALDTLAYARRLREVGFSEQQAEGQAQALAAAMTDTLATNQDLHELEVRMDARFAAAKRDVHELELRMDSRFAAARQDLRELEVRVDARFSQIDGRFDYMEKHFDLRLAERLADLERRVTMRFGGMMVAGIGVMSVLVKLL